jgi:hypothetical protein
MDAKVELFSATTLLLPSFSGGQQEIGHLVAEM